MSNSHEFFEVVTTSGHRYRFSRTQGFFYETFGNRPGFMRILREENDEVAVFCEIFNVEMAGNADEMSCLLFRERHIERCPKCGYARIENEETK